MKIFESFNLKIHFTNCLKNRLFTLYSKLMPGQIEENILLWLLYVKSSDIKLDFDTPSEESELESRLKEVMERL